MDGLCLVGFFFGFVVFLWLLLVGGVIDMPHDDDEEEEEEDDEDEVDVEEARGRKL